MSSAGWRSEILDNVTLARYADVARSSPTWLAPARVYKESALEDFMKKKNLLGAHNTDTDEYEIRYLCEDVMKFQKDLGPVLCEEFKNGSNFYYRFKREFKALQRRPAKVFEYCSLLGEQLIKEELKFVENLVNAKSSTEIKEEQLRFAHQALKYLKSIEIELDQNLHEQFTIIISDVVKKAQHTLSEWINTLMVNQSLEANYAA